MTLSFHSFRRRARCAPPKRYSLDDGHVRRLGTLLTLLGLVLHLRAFVEGAVPRALDRAEVDEQVLPALVGGDEPVALVRVEPLDSSGCHFCLSPPCQLTERARKVQTGTILNSLKLQRGV